MSVILLYIIIFYSYKKHTLEREKSQTKIDSDRKKHTVSEVNFK